MSLLPNPKLNFGAVTYLLLTVIKQYYSNYPLPICCKINSWESCYLHAMYAVNEHSLLICIHLQRRSSILELQEYFYTFGQGKFVLVSKCRRKHYRNSLFLFWVPTNFAWRFWQLLYLASSSGLFVLSGGRRTTITWRRLQWYHPKLWNVDIFS